MTLRTDRHRFRIATTSLAGCFGCHMSLLDIDERLFELLPQIEFDRSPLTDKKTLGRCDIGLVEGGVCNAENVAVLRAFRDRCQLLVAVGACAINGGLPAQRNRLPLEICLREVYGRHGRTVPDDPELPLPLDKVRPIQEIVKVDYFLPGCPPDADTIWGFLTDLSTGHTPHLKPGRIRYD